MTTAESPDYPDVPLDGAVELRIHGVSGTPVESMLGDPHPVQVWGDGMAGFYRPVHTHGADGGDAGADHVEAYSWGRLTAGAGARAAWLLLLPFMLVNVASWAHPPRTKDRSVPVGTMSAAIRVLALALTATLVVTAAVLGMDLLAWQCAGAEAACGGQHWYTRWMTDGWASGAGTRIALGAVLPIALVFLIWWLSRSTSRKYEEWGRGRDRPPNDPDVPRGVHDLAHPQFWQGGKPVARLRSLHLAAAYATIAGLVAHAARIGDPGPFAWAGAALTWAAATAAGLAAVLLFSALSGRRRELIEGRPPSRWYRVSVRVLRYGALATLLAALAYAGFLSERTAAPDALPGIQGAKQAIVVVQWAMVALLVVANWFALRARAGQPPDSTAGPLFKGYAAPVLVVLGIVVGAAFAAGLTLRTGDYLGCVTRCGTGDDDLAFVLPYEYYWSARSFAIAAMLALPAAAYVVLVARPRALRRAERNVADEYAGHDDPDRQRAIARIQARTALSDVGGAPLVFVVLGAVAVTALTTLTYDDGRIAEWFTHVGTWLVGIFALGLVALGRSAYRNPALRRTVGILWDLGTFWPRAAHPFAPPCYCERTVPEFVQRIDQVRAHSGSVVVSAHSQGTVIALAALVQLRGRADRVALLTYGSPLHRFYARAFPHFFGLPVLAWTREMLGGRWVNLYRRSDPIGGPVCCADADVPPDAVRPDRRLRDPAFDRPDFAFDWPVCRGHSCYDLDPAFAESVGLLTSEVRPEPAPAGRVKRRAGAR